MSSELASLRQQWAGFRDPTLPKGLKVLPPQRVGRVAKALVLVFLGVCGTAIFAPWVQTIQGAGQVIAYAPDQRQQRIDATITGRVAKWYVQEGSVVKAGDPIVELADNDESILERLGAERTATEARLSAQEQRLETMRERIESLRSSQRAELNAAQAQVGVATQDVKAADQTLSAALAELETNQLNYTRQKSLRDDGLASQREYELADLALRRSKANVASARAAVKAARGQLTASRAALNRTQAATNAEVENAEASLRTAETDIAESQGGLARLDVTISRQQAQTVVAPVDGQILRVISRQGGEQVTRGQALAVMVPETDDRAVELTVDGNDAALIKRGSHVRLQFEGWPAVQFSGWPSVAVGTFGGEVAFVDAADDGRGNFRVVIVPDAEEGGWPNPRFLRQGVRVKGWFLLNPVRLGFEIWRQFNAFPPIVDSPSLTVSDGAAR